MNTDKIDILVQYAGVLIILIVTVVFIVRRVISSRRRTYKGECSSCILQKTCGKKQFKRDDTDCNDKQIPLK